MYIDVRGLVIRAEKKGENGKYLTVLTPTHGVIGVNVRGGIRTASRFFASTQLYALSDMTVFYRNGHYSLPEASPVDVFFELNGSLTGLSLACWLCDAAAASSTASQEQGEIFRLLLNSLWYLSRHPELHIFIKTVFELRLLFITGYCPDFVCASCGGELYGNVSFDCRTGELRCGGCTSGKSGGVILEDGVLALMVYLSGCAPKQIFAFRPEPSAIASAGSLSESFLLTVTGLDTTRLDFYKKMSKQEDI